MVLKGWFGKGQQSSVLRVQAVLATIHIVMLACVVCLHHVVEMHAAGGHQERGGLAMGCQQQQAMWEYLHRLLPCQLTGSSPITTAHVGMWLWGLCIQWHSQPSPAVPHACPCTWLMAAGHRPSHRSTWLICPQQIPSVRSSSPVFMCAGRCGLLAHMQCEYRMVGSALQPSTPPRMAAWAAASVAASCGR
jgi:hypothetical protein